jgi:hypothetical protein
MVYLFFLRDLNDKFISPEIETNISKLVEELRDDLYCVIEYPYVDKVYRDSYYHYYSSKHFTYQRDCIRVSVFDGAVTNSDFINPERHDELRKKFLGFFVLRPTINALFGRSMISPNAFAENSYKICRCKSSCLVYGVKFESEGFPHSSQDGETIKCAETTIWALMEYFGNKYPEYKPVLPAKIHEALERFSYQRQLPSNGLTMDQISFALKEFGFGTRVYSLDAYGDELYDIIDSYVESGIPVMVGLQNDADTVGHVIIAIGKIYEKTVDWASMNKIPLTEEGGKCSLYQTTGIPAKYVVQDDNLLPYRLIDLDAPGKHYSDEDCSQFKIDSIVVPLYPKIYLETVVAKQLVLNVITDLNVGYNFGTDVVFRFYLASSRSFKNHVATLNLNGDLKNNILLTKMPKFIWCGEFYTKEGFVTEEKVALGLVILDATQANRDSIDALIFAGYPDRCVSLNENNFVVLQQVFSNFRYFDNLR